MSKIFLVAKSLEFRRHLCVVVRKAYTVGVVEVATTVDNIGVITGY